MMAKYFINNLDFKAYFTISPHLQQINAYFEQNITVLNIYFFLNKKCNKNRLF